jgi:predicted transglutaminase-like cysteine proteinase
MFCAALPRLIRRAIWAAASLAVFCEPVAATVPDYPPLFGTREVRNTNLMPFQKWTGMLARQIDERRLYEGACTERRFNRCHLQEWRSLLRTLADKPQPDQVAAVHEFMNRAAYITDPVNYGVPDYWATPIQFLRKDGDCEDYAIAKFISLRELGFANDQMRIVVLDDLNLKIAHAVLVVYLRGQALVLDNQIPTVVPAERIRHYRPIYSINEDSWWLHRP